MAIPFFITRTVQKDKQKHCQYLQVCGQWNGSWLQYYTEWLPNSQGATQFPTAVEAHRQIKLAQSSIDALGGSQKLRVQTAKHW